MDRHRLDEKDFEFIGEGEMKLVGVLVQAEILQLHRVPPFLYYGQITLSLHWIGKNAFVIFCSNYIGSPMGYMWSCKTSIAPSQNRTNVQYFVGSRIHVSCCSESNIKAIDDSVGTDFSSSLSFLHKSLQVKLQ
ncbi:hypothetical protein VNO80_24079 [Phaseolus coccineus]|uniref:Uncharacterized protein n=1 Tax=Phaseolus coccineus TaxID=3886 RepID=A0AAN9LVD4_PHACN